MEQAIFQRKQVIALITADNQNISLWLRTNIAPLKDVDALLAVVVGSLLRILRVSTVRPTWDMM